MFWLWNIKNTNNHSCANKPLNGIFKFPCSCTFFYTTINEFFILFWQLTYNTSENQKYSSWIDFAAMFCDVIFIQLYQVIMNLPNNSCILLFNPTGNTFRHSANNKIVIILIHKPVMKKRNRFCVIFLYKII